MNAKQLKKIHIWIRAIIQLLYFIFIPSVYTAAFAGVKYIFTQIGAGEKVALTSFVIHQSEVVNQKACYICREYPADFEKGGEVYYPVNNDESEALYQKYVAAVKEKYPNMILGGRLGAYRYWDMDIAIKNALELAEKL